MSSNEDKKPGTLTGAAGAFAHATKAAFDNTKEKTEKLAVKTFDAVSGGGTSGSIKDSNGTVPTAELPNVGAEAAALEYSHVRSTRSSEKGSAVSETSHLLPQSEQSAGAEETKAEKASEEQQPKTDSGNFSPFNSAAVIQIVIITIIGIVASYRQWEEIRLGNVPLHLAILWAILAFFSGHILWPTNTKAVEAKETDAAKDTAGMKEEPSEVVATTTHTRAAVTTQVPPKRKRDAFYNLFPDVSLPKLHKSDNDGGNREGRSATSLGSLAELPTDLWTCLEEKADHMKFYWEKHVNDSTHPDLKNRLLKYDDFRTIAIAPKTESTASADDDVSMPQASSDKNKVDSMGKVDTGNDRASILEADIEVDPLFKLRGMDIFRTNTPEEKVWRQPILEQNGLRDVPTFLVNLMLPQGNLVIYFQMPHWIKRFQDIKIEDGDLEDTKALKLFLMGDDNYRTPRWKILPCLVDGPYVIKMMAPEKSEKTIAGRRIDAKWHQYDENIDAETGKRRCALLEVDCDLGANPGVRKIVNIILGHVKSVVMDCAMIIDKPYLSEVPEPSACLGLFRMDHIDMNQTGIIPEKDEEELLHEVSIILGSEKTSVVKSMLEEEAAKLETVQEGG